MDTVGIRELKNRLSYYVQRVRAGESVVVTDRGAVVAELRPPRAGGPALPPGLSALAQRGVVRLGRGNDPAAYPRLAPVAPPGTAARLIDEDRGE